MPCFRLLLEFLLQYTCMLWKVLVTQCPILCDLMDCSPPGSNVHGTLQERILEWVDTHFSRGSSWPLYWTWVSCTADSFFTIWAIREALHIYIYFGHGGRLAGSWFPDQGLKPCLLQWKQRVLITRLLGNSMQYISSISIVFLAFVLYSSRWFLNIQWIYVRYADYITLMAKSE